MHSGRLLLHFDGVDDRTAAEALHRTLLLADENDTVMLANRYIWEGSRAIQVSGYNESIAQQAHRIVRLAEGRLEAWGEAA